MKGKIHTALRLLVLAAGMSSAAAWSEQQRWDFDVYLDQRLLGSHSFTVQTRARTQAAHAAAAEAAGADRYAMVSRASFAVKLLFIRAFNYQHRSDEIYAGGCLQSLESETVSGSERYAVSVSKRKGVLHILTDSNQPGYAVEQKLSDCLMTFAYWDPRILQQEALLNSQTGELVKVNIRALPTEAFSGVAAQPYEIVGVDDEKVRIKVWYDQHTQRWIGLESRLQNGRMLRYRLSNPPGGLHINV